MGALSIRDYERRLDLAVALLEEDQPDTGWRRITAELNKMMNGSACMFIDDVRVSPRTGHVTVWMPEELRHLPMDALLLDPATAIHPLSLHYSGCNDRAPRAVNDVPDSTAWRRTAVYETVRSLGFDQQMCLPLPNAHEVPRPFRSFFIAWATGDHITEHHQAFAQRIQPLLIQIDRHWQQLRRFANHPSASRLSDPPHKRAADVGLTPREMTVLALLADGLTAVAIARELAITPRTVNTHLERIYRKLGTRDRLRTVLRAHHIGLIIPPGA